jgi:hypothetical protein
MCLVLWHLNGSTPEPLNRAAPESERTPFARGRPATCRLDLDAVSIVPFGMTGFGQADGGLWVTNRPVVAVRANWLALQLWEPAMEHPHCMTTIRELWNQGKLVGQKAPLKLKEIGAIRIRLQLANRRRELAEIPGAGSQERHGRRC